MDDYNYIDNYFKGMLPPEEMKRFDQKIQEDPAFAENIAFYCSTMQEIKNQVAENKKQRFREMYDKANLPARPGLVRRFWPYLAAAAVIGVVFLVLMFTKPAPAEMADQYVRQHFQNLPVTMSNREDEMKKGLQLYNENKLPAALQQFENIIQSDTADFTAKKNAGIVCLRMEQYDKALEYFRQIAAKPGYYSNPGLFYQAITLLKRNHPADTKTAENLLREVVEKDLEGSKIAGKWLKVF
jgi:tetratricopeptide (TPR) repeat protein